MAVRSPHFAIVKRLLLTQLVVAVAFPIALLPFGTNAALSAAAGGMAYLIPNVYFAIQAFRYTGARAANQIARSMFKGEFGKLALTALIFIVLFKYLKSLNYAAVFGGFIMVQLVVWITPLLAGWKTNSSS